MRISNDHLVDYLLCKYKVLLKLEKRTGEFSDYLKFKDEVEEAYRYKAVAALLTKHNLDSCKEFQGIGDLTKGYPLISAVSVKWEDLHAHIDAIDGETGRAALDTLSYIPILFHPWNKVTSKEKVLLAFIGLVLEQVQRKEVLYGKVVHGDQCRISKVDLRHHRKRISWMIPEIRLLINNGNRPNLILNANCQVCEFQEDCEKVAVDKDDLSLLRSMKEKEIRNQNDKGIFTVTQYSYTFRPSKRRRRLDASPGRRLHALQALAIRKRKVFVYKKEKIPSSPINLYMDIEADPDRDFVYLIGMLFTNQRDYVRQYSFWADSQKEQSLIAENFLKTIRKFNDFNLFHYGSYETRFLKSLNRLLPAEYGNLLNEILSKSVNVLALIHENIYFPVYENSLKSIAKYLGFRWSDEGLFGVGSIMLRKRWEKSNAEKLKYKLVTYNSEDCYALKEVMDYVAIISGRGSGKSSEKDPADVKFVRDLKGEVSRKYKKIDFLIENFEYINNCAYFDYHQRKVAVRTNKHLKRRVEKASKSRKPLGKVNQTVECSMFKTCPQCAGTKIYRHQRYERLVLDLKFVKGGVKRWLTKFLVYRFRCAKCGKIFWSEDAKKIMPIRRKFGWKLIAWSTDENLVKGVTFRKLRTNIEDLFGISLSVMTLNKFKSYVADYYRETYDQIIQRILKSSVILIDETTISLKDEIGYVWALTNMDDVFYLYRSSRGGAFLKDLFQDFHGVLVSDFFSAYHSLSCAQQKCLVHLIRDLNDDLYKNPFNQELGDLAQNFSELLQDIVKTIDRYGLKQRHLRKFNKRVDRFYREAIGRDCESEIVYQYHKRFRKYRAKLFTFINHDGVPWNNNGVEHAIKHLAHCRRTVKGKLTKRSLESYLVLLSIYQSCEYRRINFFDFLLSGNRVIS